jgi:NAD(P)H-hydrate epimerase
MEHAAIGVAEVVESERRRLGRERVVVVCGPGGNGGDGWAVARLLANRGIPVSVASLAPPTPGSDAAINETAARRLATEAGTRLTILDRGWTPDALTEHLRGGLVVDAMYGVGLSRPIAGTASVIIDAIATSAAPVISIDIPSGLDAAIGRPIGPCVRAMVTATMVAPKTGMLTPGASDWTGRIEVVDIGTPPSLLVEFGRVAGSAPVGDDACSRSGHGAR